MISVLICDDDQAISSQIVTLLDTYAQARGVEFQIAVFNDPNEAFRSEAAYDLAFIDIEMPGMNGLTLAARVKEQNPDVLVLIVTAYERYLDDAMDLHVYRYLSKPIEKERFYHSLTLALREYQNIHREVVVECRGQTLRIPTREIVYLAISGRKTQIRTTRDEYRCADPLREWAARIHEPQNFAYSHHSYLINLQYVTNFNRDGVTVQFGDSQREELPMSQRKYAAFRASFLEYMGSTL